MASSTKFQIPSSKLQRNPGIETPKTKLQTPKKSQVPSSKPRPALRAWSFSGVWSLVFGVWDLVLLWSLEFGIWSFLPEISASQELRCAPWANQKKLASARRFPQHRRERFAGVSRSVMKAKIIITPKKAVVDPQGK